MLDREEFDGELGFTDESLITPDNVADDDCVMLKSFVSKILLLMVTAGGIDPRTILSVAPVPLSLTNSSWLPEIASDPAVPVPA